MKQSRTETRQLVRWLAVAWIVAACGQSGVTAAPSVIAGAPGTSPGTGFPGASSASSLGPSAGPGSATASMSSGAPSVVASQSAGPAGSVGVLPSVGPSASGLPTSGAPVSSPGASGTVAPSSSVGPGASSSAIAVSLPVMPCTVTDGAIQGPAPTPNLRSLEVHVTPDEAARLVVYGVETDQLILGPRGWRCTGLVGADGSSHVTIVNPQDPTTGVVVDSAPGAPFSGVLDLACPLFPDADQQLHATFGFDCPKHQDPAEDVVFETPQIARFTDPPHVKAVGALSGGAVPVDGALIYHVSSDNVILAFQISCAMRPADGALCVPIVDDWVARIRSTFLNR